MIFHRLAVSHFKGIKNVEIAFAPRGITLVEGRNEIGKSSLVHALTTLFEEPISRTRKKLEHLIPNDGGGTPEIELEAESGRYRFVYRKSYIENKAAELTILGPHPERFEGGEAQENFERILNETLDRSLWRALMLQQGNAVGLPEVKDQQTLIAALDKAAAGQAGADDAGSLYDRVAEEYGKYYHTGHAGELQRLRDLRDAVAAAEAAAGDARECLADLDGKIVKSRELRQSLHSLGEREKTEQRTLHECGERLSRVETLEKTLAAEKNKQERARENRAAAHRGREDRRRLVDMEGAARETLTRTSAALEAARSAETEAARIAAEKKALLEQHALERARSEKLAALRRADHEHHRDMFDLKHMRERKERIDASVALVSKARVELTTNAVTDKAVAEIRAAESEVAQARARRDAAIPRIRLDAIAPCDVVLDGETLHLTPGGGRELPVTDSVNLEIPGMLSVKVTPGHGGDNLEEQLTKAGERLHRLLARYGMEDPADAPGILEKRREAERVIVDHKRVEKENLRDLVYSGDIGGLVERIAELEEKNAAYERKRPAEPALSPDLDRARMERDKTEEAREAAIENHREAEAAWEAAAAAQRLAKDELIRLEAEGNSAVRELERLRLSLEESRGGATDADLEADYANADAAFSDASRSVAVIETDLKTLGSELVRGRLDTLRAALARTAGEKTDARERLARLEAELELIGGNGLNERVEETEADLDHKNRLLRAELRRAEAAKILYAVISEARERSQKAYVLPLKNQIEDLARSVYATNVGVELTPDLQIAGRIMNGQTVVFAQLSGGAREQFSLIHRAACSLAVSKDGGVPLILDDALGYSDTARLIGMNEVLSRAAQRCQIIILTCMPSRYAYIEPAARIDMEELLR